MIRLRQGARATPPRVLVVEDDRSVACLIHYQLEAEGLLPVTARDADHGWRLLEADSADAAVIDLRLPGKDGWWLVQRIRSSPRLSTLPVVIVTGLVDPSFLHTAAALGCEFLLKPFAAATLVERLAASVEAVRRAHAG